MIQNPFCELDEHWAKRQAQNHVADQMHYLLFGRASVIQFRTLTYLWSEIRKKLNSCEENKALYSANMPAKIENNKHDLKRWQGVLSHCLGNSDCSTSKQMKEVAYSNGERWHPASGFSGWCIKCSRNESSLLHETHPPPEHSWQTMHTTARIATDWDLGWPHQR